MSFKGLRSEYEREVIGFAILAEVRRACSSRARRYPPIVYARSATWNDDAIDDLIQDVITHRLLGERQLDYLFDVGRTIDAWRALLDRQVRITLARRRVRTVVDNLLDRAKRLLDRDDSVQTSTVTKRAAVYSLRGTGASYVPLTDETIRRVVEDVRVVPRQIPGREERAPTVYSKRNLDALLRTVLRHAPGGIAVRDLGRILELVLTDWVPAVLEQDEGLIAAVVEDPGEIASAREVARRMVSGWSDDEATIVSGLLAGLPYVEIARRVSVSRPTVIKRQRVLMDSLRAAAEDFEEIGQRALIDEVATSVVERRVTDEPS